jgi:hypothetical protein
MIVIAEQFDEVEITDEDAGQIDVVGDLIRFVEDATAASAKARKPRQWCTGRIADKRLASCQLPSVK